MESEPQASRRRGAASSFTEEEAAFLAENFLGRVATVSLSGQPHVVPVAYKFDGKTITFGGWNLEKSLKFRNMMSNQKVAFVVDEIVSTRPWRVRGLEVRGRAEPIRGSEGVTGVRIIPVNIRSWGLKG
ncbi:MAG TPA: PPOX class F420-dependent oxidoreductase [Nitrososphaerales archaeon]|nr:PPOX class F420-dependent oxidoreductase [Nitrososphaerales archaeon]